MIEFRNFIKESIIDPMQKTLDRSVFQNPENDEATISPLIARQIEDGIRQFEQLAPIHDYYLVGSILGKRYNKNSDLDITVEILEDDVDDATKDKLYDLLSKVNGRMAYNSTHPINYHFNFVKPEDDLSDNFDNIYDLKTNSWEKKTDDRHVDPMEFMDEFEEKIQSIDLNAMEIRRDLIDIDMLHEFSKDEIEDLMEMVEEKLEDIEDNIEEMIDSEEEIAQTRRDAFDDITPEELKKLGSKNALPINIIYKLMERYYYLELIADLKKILNEDDEIGEDDIPKVKQALRKFDDELDDDLADVETDATAAQLESFGFNSAFDHRIIKEKKNRYNVPTLEDAVEIWTMKNRQ